MNERLKQLAQLNFQSPRNLNKVVEYSTRYLKATGGGDAAMNAMLGQAYQLMGNDKAAIASVQTAVRLSGGRPAENWLRILLQSYGRLGDSGRRVADHRSARQPVPDAGQLEAPLQFAAQAGCGRRPDRHERLPPHGQARTDGQAGGVHGCRHHRYPVRLPGGSPEAHGRLLGGEGLRPSGRSPQPSASWRMPARRFPSSRPTLGKLAQQAAASKSVRTRSRWARSCSATGRPIRPWRLPSAPCRRAATGTRR
ncbi:MAG: hypothetical protein MZV49_04870 [Rhodopseudomonas palustris]|nr:hypothetical protein [Rhodopseudomonas palustris]